MNIRWHNFKFFLSKSECARNDPVHLSKIWATCPFKKIAIFLIFKFLKILRYCVNFFWTQPEAEYSHRRGEPEEMMRRGNIDSWKYVYW